MGVSLSNCETLKSQIASSEFLISYLKGQELLNEKDNLANLKREYSNSGCGVNLLNDKCISTENQIISLTNLIATQGTLALTDNRIYGQIDVWKKQLAQLKADYALNGCVSRVEEIKQAKIQEIAKTYQDLSKTRIDTTSIYERNKRVFFGTIVLLLALVLITTNKKNKKWQ